MKRRDVMKSGLTAGIAGVIGVPPSGATLADGNHFYELRTYELRNDLQPARIQEFFQHHFLPACKRLNLGPVGCFSVVSGLQTPSLLVLIDYKSLAELQTSMEAFKSDKEFAKAWQAFEASGEMPYVRYTSSLFRAFDAHSKIEIPAGDEKRAPRLYELRTYQSRNAVSFKNKLDMFNQEEIKIFRDCGFAPVFFGEAVMGTELPHLTYLVGFDNMAARDKAWDAFRVNPDWARVRNKPGWTDPEAVSKIHAAFLRPTNYSQIR
jgi:hypothetical protein